MTIELALLISVISVSFAVANVIYNMRRNGRADERREATDMAAVMVKLDNISASILEIKKTLEDNRRDIKDNSERIAKLEESAKSAHRRIDNIEKGRVTA